MCWIVLSCDSRTFLLAFSRRFFISGHCAVIQSHDGVWALTMDVATQFAACFAGVAMDALPCMLGWLEEIREGLEIG